MIDSKNADITSANISLVRPHLGDPSTAHALPEGYTLRRLEHADEPQLAQLLNLAFGGTWDEARVRDALTGAPDVGAVYGVVRDGELVATASSQSRPERDPAAGFVHWLAAHPEHRSRGLARALLGRIIEDFRGRGYACARLDTQPERLPAIRAYLKFGFVPVYETGGDPEDQKAVWSIVFQTLTGAAGHRLADDAEPVQTPRA